VLLILCCGSSSLGRLVAVPAPSSSSEIGVPRGHAIDVDGVKTVAEWDDASMTQFTVGPDWNVRVFAKHAAQYLYFDWEGVTHAGTRLFPEILLDPHNAKSAVWQKSQWLHVSNHLCEGNGAPDVYETKGRLQCARREPGSDGSNPPHDRSELIEVKTSFAELDVEYSPGMKIGMALDVTDANGPADQEAYF
jgi:hypothetical protein